MKATTDVFKWLARQSELAVLSEGYKRLKKLGYTVYSDSENYVIGVPAVPSPVCLVAHCDIVGQGYPEKIIDRCGVLTADGRTLGADDRAGVTAIWMTLAAGHRPMVIFTNGEERGCVGAGVIAKTGWIPDQELPEFDSSADELTSTQQEQCVRVLIQLDRRHANDFVTYSCESPALDEWVSSFGYEKAHGSCSDISTLAPHWGIAAANLSVGYDGEHTSKETLIVPHLQHTIDRVGEMIKRPPEARLPYIKKTWPQYSGGYGGYDGDENWRGNNSRWGYGGNGSGGTGRHSASGVVVYPPSSGTSNGSATNGNGKEGGSKASASRDVDDTDLIVESESGETRLITAGTGDDQKTWLERLCKGCQKFVIDYEYDSDSGMCWDCFADSYDPRLMGGVGREIADDEMPADDVVVRGSKRIGYHI